MSRCARIIVLAGLLVLAACSAESSPSATLSPGPTVPAPSTTASAAGSAVQLYAPLGYPGGGTIAFVRGDPLHDANATWLIHPDGSGETRLRVTTDFSGAPADFNGDQCCLVFSPDGSRVAIAYDDTSGLFGDNGIRKTQILDLAGTRVGQVPQVCGGCASIQGVDITARAWSPDGTVIAVSTSDPEDSDRTGISLAHLDGNGLWSQVTSGFEDFPIAFSPDNRRLLFLRPTEEGRGALMQGTRQEPANGETVDAPLTVQQISPEGWTVAQDDYIGPAASYSPDGTQIAFVATDGSGQGSRLYLTSADGGAPTAIAGPAAGMTTAAWSPDGKRIAFDGSISRGPHDVYVVHPDGTDLVDLTLGLGLGACCMHWSSDSMALLVQATATDDAHGYLFIVQLDGDRFWQVTTEPTLYENVSWGAAPG